MTRLLVIGDAMLDVDQHGRVARLCPDAPVPVVDLRDERDRPGGAALAAVLAAREGAEVTLVTALGDDGPGARIRQLVGEEGVHVVDLGLAAPTPVKARVWAAEHVVLRVDRGASTGPAHIGPLPDLTGALADADVVLVSDYGRGMAAVDALRGAVVAARRPLVWDPHPNGPVPVSSTWLVTPNEDELARLVLVPTPDGSLRAVASMARAALDAWGAKGIAVTRGAAGAVLVTGEGPPLVATVREPVAGNDACGAGDRFAVSASLALAAGAVLSEAVEDAVQDAAAFVEAGGARAFARTASLPVGAPDGRVGTRAPAVGECRTEPVPVADAATVAARVRGRNGTVVAAGGCFDLLHAGHVELLRRARSLGDCLIVCLNSDASVRSLKGDGRPVVTAADRRTVLQALAAVDAVVVFDEVTPIAVLEDLRPDLYVKGGDYGTSVLPEQAILDRWGGVAVAIPYVAGRSTTRLVQEVIHGS